MSEQLDNELKKRIIEVFDDYEDTLPAQEGWELLRQNFPEPVQRQKAAGWWWRGIAAAILLALLSFGLWMYLKPRQQQPVLAKQRSIKTHLQKDTLATAEKQPAQQPAVASNQPSMAITGSQAAISQQVYASGRTEQHSAKFNYPHPADGMLMPADRKTKSMLAANQPTTPATALSTWAQTSTAPTAKADSPTNVAPTQAYTRAVQPAKPTVASTDTTAGTDHKTMEALLAAEHTPTKQALVASHNTEKQSTANKRVLYSVYAGTFFNYADGSKNQVNAGAGFSADIKLVGNLKLSTGLAIARNSFSFDTQPTNPALLRSAMALNSSRQVQAAPTELKTLGLLATFAAPADPVVSAYQISLTGLDVPINLKYEFNPKKTDAYISAGLSSGTFFNESYKYSYSLPYSGTLSRSTTTASIPDASTRASFARFDFARMLNLSVGVGYQLNNHNRLVIEPFMKYPLNGMGSQQLRFGAGGINLKLKFQTGKK